MKRARQTRRRLAQALARVLHKARVQPNHFLIANLELRFLVTRCKQTFQPVSNRKYFAIFGRAFSVCSSLEPPASSLQNPWPPRPVRRGERLIVTPRLEFLATPTKQSLRPNSNRYKTRFLRSPWRTRFLRHGCINQLLAGSSRVTRHPPLISSVPLWPIRSPRRTALTLPHPHSNLAASCFVRAFAGEHS